MEKFKPAKDQSKTKSRHTENVSASLLRKQRCQYDTRNGDFNSRVIFKLKFYFRVTRNILTSE